MTALWLFLPEYFREFLIFIFSGSNLIYTGLLILVVCYWLLVIVGAFDFDLFDFDMDADADLEVDVAGDMIPGFFERFLAFFNIGEMPVMLVLSVTILALWVVAICSSFFLHPYLDGALKVVIVIPEILFAALMGKLVMIPMKKAFELTKHDYEKVNIEGSVASAGSDLKAGEIGQAIINRTGAPIRIMIVLGDRCPEVKKGQELVVVKKGENGTYLAEAMDLVE